MDQEQNEIIKFINELQEENKEIQSVILEQQTKLKRNQAIIKGLQKNIFLPLDIKCLQVNFDKLKDEPLISDDISLHMHKPPLY